MKRVFAILLVLTMCFGMAACGAPKTVEEAVEKANSMVAKWDKKTEKLCTYEGEFNAIESKDAVEGYAYFVFAKSLTVEDETDTAKQINARHVSEFVNEKLLPVFAEFDVDLVVAVKDETGTYYMTNNGEVIFNKYE